MNRNLSRLLCFKIISFDIKVENNDVKAYHYSNIYEQQLELFYFKIICICNHKIGCYAIMNMFFKHLSDIITS